MVKRSKRLVSILAVLLSFSLVATGCGKKEESKTDSSSSDKKISVKIGADSSTFSIQYYVAKEKGFFEKNGIDAEITTYSYGIDTLNAALTGQVDIGIAADFAALSRLNSGDLKILSFTQTGKADSTKLVARDGISSAQELKGKSIGQQKATVNEYAWAKYLDKVGLKQDDVVKQGLSSTAELLAAFERGDVKAAFFGGSFLDKALKVDGAKVIGSYGEIPFAYKGFAVAKDSLLKDQPEAAERVLKALEEATEWIKANNEEAGEIAFKTYKIPKESVVRELKDLTLDIRLSQEDVDQLKDVYDYATKNNLFKADYNLKDKIVSDPLKKISPDKVTFDSNKLN
ncbi:MAG: ABC transporter substrate-binding protein [Clostridiaceae bacterium]